MKTRSILASVLLFTITFNSFPGIKYKIVQETNENKIVFTFPATEVKYTIGTKTAEYVMAYLANSTFVTAVESKVVNYNGKDYTIAVFYTGGDLYYYKIGFLRAENETDVVKIYRTDNDAELHTFELPKAVRNNSPLEVVKFDYVIGQIIKWRIFSEINGGGGICIRNVTKDANGVPTRIDFEAYCNPW